MECTPKSAISSIAISDITSWPTRCCAGTTLGDPVEINAAASALLPHGRQSPLALLASKSWHGHGEPAAGLIALQHAALAARQQQQLPIMHLRSLNLYITGILDMLPQQTSVAGLSAAKQSGPLPVGGHAVITGTSSFAFMVSTSTQAEACAAEQQADCINQHI